MSSIMNPRTRSGELRYALFAFMIANMIAFAAYAQAPPPGAVPQGPAGSAPGAQPPLPGAVPQGPAGSAPGAKPPLPGAVPQGPAGSAPGAKPPLPGAVPQGPAGGAPGMQAPPPGAVPQGPAGSAPSAKPPLPGAVPQVPAGSAPGAKPPLSGAVPKVPAGSPPGAEQIMTAIDVSDRLSRGDSNAEIATLLSYQKDFDRASALKKGQTDEQIIKYLITKTENLPPVQGVDRAKQHENEGDKQFRASNYNRAAKEYSLSIAYSDKSFRPYQSRADSYMQYLKTVLIPATKSGASGEKRGVAIDR